MKTLGEERVNPSPHLLNCTYLCANVEKCLLLLGIGLIL